MNWRQMMYVSQALVILLASNSREACAEDAKRVERSYSFFFSGSTFGKSCLFSLNVPVKAWMNAFRKTLKIVVMTAAFGLSKLPLKGALVPNRSLGWLRIMRVNPPTIPCQTKSIGLTESLDGLKIT